VVLFALWLAAVVRHFVVSAAFHVLLAAAVALLLIGLMLGRRTASSLHDDRAHHAWVDRAMVGERASRPERDSVAVATVPDATYCRVTYCRITYWRIWCLASS